MAVKTPEEVLRAFVQWCALQTGDDPAEQLAHFDDDQQVKSALLKFVEFSREGVRDAALDEAIDVCEAALKVGSPMRNVLDVDNRIRAMKGGG